MKPGDIPTNYYFGGGGETSVTSLSLWVLFIAGTLIVLLPRKYVVVPLFVAGLLIPVGNTVVVAGMHLMVARLLLLVGWVRMIWSRFLTKQDPHPYSLNSLDKALVYWALSNAVMYVILWRVFGALVNRAGFLCTTLGEYFLLRYLIRDRADIIRCIKCLAMICLLISVFMVRENLTGRNAFAVFGGVGEFSAVRDGRIRAQGPFEHPIIAGTFGGMLLPLFVAIWRDRQKRRLLAGLAVVASVAMAYASASSTPVMAVLTGVAALCFWPFRRNLRAVRWTLVITLIVLQSVMKASVWFLIARLSGLTGGTGWHRAALVDEFIRHFGEWWLTGTQSNGSWGTDMWDTINAYVNAGVEGGLVTFVLFVSVFVYAYKRIGAARALVEGDRRDERLIWALGATVFSNTVAFFGIVYFDQSAIAWYALLAMVCAMTTLVVDPKQPQPKVEYGHMASEPIGWRARASRRALESLAGRPPA